VPMQTQNCFGRAIQNKAISNEPPLQISQAVEWPTHQASLAHKPLPNSNFPIIMITWNVHVHVQVLDDMGIEKKMYGDKHGYEMLLSYKIELQDRLRTKYAHHCERSTRSIHRHL
jgi:hypothetical protein